MKSSTRKALQSFKFIAFAGLMWRENEQDFMSIFVLKWNLKLHQEGCQIIFYDRLMCVYSEILKYIIPYNY